MILSFGNLRVCLGSHGLFIDYLPVTHGDFSIVMLNCRRVDLLHSTFPIATIAIVKLDTFDPI